MKKVPAVGQLVVMNHSADATMFRVKDHGKFQVGVIDATIEDSRPNQAVQWVDTSLVLAPTVGQLSAFTQ